MALPIADEKDKDIKDKGVKYDDLQGKKAMDPVLGRSGSRGHICDILNAALNPLGIYLCGRH